MADIELVITISEEAKRAFDCAESNDLKAGYYDFGGVIGAAIKNGTPLPKGHGRLIDADKLYGDFIDGTEGYDCQTWNRIEIGDIIEDAETIIPADTETWNGMKGKMTVPKGTFERIRNDAEEEDTEI